MAAFNAQDPRYQRKQQRVDSANSMMGGRRIGSVLTGAVSAKHAASQGSRIEQLKGIGLASQMRDQAFKMDLIRSAQRDKGLSLAENRLNFEQSFHQQGMKDAEKALKTTIMSGIVQTGMSAWEGKQRADKIAEATTKQNQRDDWMKTFMTNSQNIQRGRSGDGSLMAYRALNGGLY